MAFTIASSSTRWPSTHPRWFCRGPSYWYEGDVCKQLKSSNIWSWFHDPWWASSFSPATRRTAATWGRTILFMTGTKWILFCFGNDWGVERMHTTPYFRCSLTRKFSSFHFFFFWSSFHFRRRQKCIDTHTKVSDEIAGLDANAIRFVYSSSGKQKLVSFQRCTSHSYIYIYILMVLLGGFCILFFPCWVDGCDLLTSSVKTV